MERMNEWRAYLYKIALFSLWIDKGKDFSIQIQIVHHF